MLDKELLKELSTAQVKLLNERVNCFQLILYSESETLNFNEVIEKVKSVEFYSCKWYYIQHQNEVNNITGEFKKNHYHLLIKLDNAISVEKLLKALSNELNFVSLLKDFSIVKSFKGAVRYLIHYDNKEKQQYNLNEIITNDKNLSYYFNDNSILDNFKMIVNILDYNKDIHNMKDLIYYCVNNNELLAMQYIQDNAYLVNCLFRG